jgi:hypothetical protein
MLKGSHILVRLESFVLVLLGFGGAASYLLPKCLLSACVTSLDQIIRNLVVVSITHLVESRHEIDHLLSPSNRGHHFQNIININSLCSLGRWHRCIRAWLGVRRHDEQV